MDNFYPNTSRSISFKSSWDSGKEQEEKKTAKNYNKSDLVFKINFTPVVTFVSFAWFMQGLH